MIGRLLCLLYGATGVIGIAAWVARDDRMAESPLRLVGNVLLVLVAPVFLRMRAPRAWVVNASTAVGAVLVSLAVHVTADPAAAISVSMLYLLVGLPTFYLYPQPVAWAHCAGIAALAMTGLTGNELLGPQEMVRGTGVALTLAVVVSWLVRAGDLAERDYTTGLPNRRGFERHAQEFLRRFDGARRAALVVIDLDEFHAVNERRGFGQGNRLLMETGRAWARTLPDTAMLARHGGDEFTLLVDDATAQDVDGLLAAMRSATPQVSLTAGVAWCAPGESLTMLMLRADSAIYAAKRRGAGQTVVAADVSSVRDGETIRRALRDGELALHFQPIVDLRTGEVDKAEALVRWLPPDGRVVRPDEFIHVAERTGVMLDLGDWIVATACRTAATWPPRADGGAMAVSVNASGAELQDPTYAARVIGHVASAGLAPEQVVIELVESDFSLDTLSVRENLAALGAAGVRLAIDDFGTGHSSLSRLEQLHVDILKIDRSFVSALTSPAQPMPVVTAILAMATALGLDVVAEGVETPAQAEWLTVHGCSHAQGYHYGRPAPRLEPRLST